MKQRGGWGGWRRSSEPLGVVKKAGELLSPNSKVLDLAVGEGRHGLYLARKGHEVLGVDVSDRGFSKIEERKKDEDLKIELVRKDVLEFESEKKFDLVLATGLLHFFSKEDVERTVEKMKGFVKVGGYSLLATRMDQNTRRSLSYLFESGEMKKYYKKGWEVVEYEEIEKEMPPRVVQVILAKKVE